MLRVGFEELGLHRIVAILDDRNTPSAQLLERLGMRREAHHLEALQFKGEWANEYVYALTFLNSESLLTLPVGLQHFFTEFATNWPGLMAAAFIMSVPVVVMFMLLQKQFVRALTEGAVKS